MAQFNEVGGYVPNSQTSLVTEASNKLGLRLLQVLSKEKRNVFISPFSLSTALTMVLCGTGAETRVELAKVLCYEDTKLSNEYLSSEFLQLLSAWDKVPEAYVLSMANSILTQKDFSVKVDYKSFLRESFKAELFEVNFAKESQKAVSDINDWVKEKTNGMISNLLDSLDPMAVVVILNAIYFKGSWLRKFDKRLTTLQGFYNNGIKENVKEVDMMHRKFTFGYVERESFKLLQLNYVGEEIAMLVFLPNSLQGLDELEKQLSSTFLQDLKKEIRHRKVTVALPKFRFEYSKSLKETFRLLGLRRLFKSGANFGGLSDCKSLSVSEIIHKAVIEVNEEGSEAAAATAGMIHYKCERIDRDPQFIVDHPFLFIIYDIKNNLILFLGRIDEL